MSSSPRNKPDSTSLDVSVIIVSRGRPTWLARCLKAVRQLDYPSFEVVVVADQASLNAVNCSDLKVTTFDRANISAARNAGIRQAAGEICAFIDDDAVPEPLWLRQIVNAFSATDADAVVGYVRGRNGISYQSRTSSVDVQAETHGESDEGTDPFVPNLKTGRALKLVGTNMSFRREALIALDGFDEAFAYYLDDTDISLRLAKSGRRAAVAPLAEVHHGFAPSERRTNLRAPTNLFDIARSSAIFFRRHATPNVEELRDRIVGRERKRLIQHMVIGTCEPRDIRNVLSSLEVGWENGQSAHLVNDPRNLRGNSIFSPLKPYSSGHHILSSRLIYRGKTLQKAAKLTGIGQRASVFSFSLTPVRHHVRYTSSGIWVQTGGQFGRTARNSKRFVWCRFASRLRDERLRVAKIRGIYENVTGGE